MTDQIQKLKSLFFEPTNFFKSVEKEKDYGKFIIYFLIIYAITTLISTIASLPVSIKQNGALAAFIGSFFGLIFSIMFSPIIPFMSAGLTHLGVMLMKGKNGFLNTFKPSTYSVVASSIYTAIVAVILAVVENIFPVNWAALQNLDTFSWSEFPTIYIATAIVLGLATWIHVVYIEVVGIAKFQNMSKLKALVATLIIPLIIIAPIFISIAALAYFGVLSP